MLKITVLVLGLVFLVLMINPTVLSQNVEVSIPASSGAPGGDVTIPVNISDVTGLGIIGVDMTLQYDPQILSAIETDKLGTIAAAWQIVSSTNTVPADEAAEEIVIKMIGMDPLSGSGTFVKVKFSVRSDAEIGDTSEISITAQLNEGAVGATTSDGLFTVENVPIEERLEGDVNGDNRVDRLDLLKLVLTYNKNSGDPGYDPAADLDSDGRIDKNDVIILWRNFGATRG